MLSLQYMHMRMDGNRDGTDGVSTADVLAQFPVAPLNMDMDMVMAGAMYGITIFQDLDGPQLERDWALVFGVRKAF